jgi:flagellar biosynthesis/type III secretory pathway protein FliH
VRSRSSGQVAMTSSEPIRSWVVRDAGTAALLVPLAAPPPTAEDVDAAYTRGVEDGLRSAEQQQAHAVVALQDAARSAQLELSAHIERSRATTISLAVDLATELARWMVNEAIAADPAVLRSRVELALDAIADEPRATFVVAPCMVDHVRRWLGTDASVEGDDGLDPGELRVDAGHATLDATYDVALARARAALVASYDHVALHRLDVREPA